MGKYDTNYILENTYLSRADLITNLNSNPFAAEGLTRQIFEQDNFGLFFHTFPSTSTGQTTYTKFKIKMYNLSESRYYNVPLTIAISGMKKEFSKIDYLNVIYLNHQTNLTISQPIINRNYNPNACFFTYINTNSIEAKRPFNDDNKGYEKSDITTLSLSMINNSNLYNDSYLLNALKHELENLTQQISVLDLQKKINVERINIQMKLQKIIKTPTSLIPIVFAKEIIETYADKNNKALINNIKLASEKKNKEGTDKVTFSKKMKAILLISLHDKMRIKESFCGDAYISPATFEENYNTAHKKLTLMKNAITHYSKIVSAETKDAIR